MLFAINNKLGNHMEKSFGRKYTILPLVLSVSDEFLGFEFLTRVTNVMDSLETVRGVMNEKAGEIFYACILWYNLQTYQCY